MHTVRDNSTQLSRFITDKTLLPSNLDTLVHPKMAALDIILNTAFGLKNKRKSSSRNEKKKDDTGAYLHVRNAAVMTLVRVYPQAVVLAYTK